MYVRKDPIMKLRLFKVVTATVSNEVSSPPVSVAAVTDVVQIKRAVCRKSTTFVILFHGRP